MENIIDFYSNIIGIVPEDNLKLWCVCALIYTALLIFMLDIIYKTFFGGRK